MASITETQNSRSPDLLAKTEYSTGTYTPSPSNDVRKALSIWARIRLQLKEPFAEFLGTCLVRTRYSSQNTSLKVFEMVASLQGVVAQVSLANLQFGTYFSISVVTGTAVMLGVLVAGPVSGGHLNPSVTLAFVVFRKLSPNESCIVLPWPGP
jgi:hypothetical protein